MNDAARMPNPSPYSFGTMTFVFGLVLGALIGGLFLAGRTAAEDDAAAAAGAGQIAELQAELRARTEEVAALHDSLEAADRELQSFVEEMTAMEPTDLQAAIEVADARQLEIDSLSAELGGAYAELEQLRALQGATESAVEPTLTVQYALVLETMHNFAGSGYMEPEMYAEDPALGDALIEIGDPELAAAVSHGILQSSPADPAPLFSSLQRVLNHLVDRF